MIETRSGRRVRHALIALGAVGALALGSGVPLESAADEVLPPAEVFECLPGAVQESQEYTVPDGVTRVTIEAFGGQGGDGLDADNPGGAGGLGGYSRGTFEVTPGETLTVNVG